MKIDWKKISLLLAAFFVLEFLSFGAVLNEPVFLILVLAALILTAIKLEYGLLLVLAELFIGSMGHLFYLDLAAARLPLRIGLFAALMAVFAVKFIYQLIRDRGHSRYLKSLRDFSGWKYFLTLAAFILIAVVSGWFRGNDPSALFADFNAWPYFLLIIPVIIVYSDGDEKKFQRLRTVFLAGTFWLSLKTLIFLFIFAHSAGIGPAVYYWLRRTLGGEVTIATAGWPRIFIQGQMYAAIAFLLVFWLRPLGKRAKDFFSHENLSWLLLAGFFLSTVLVGMSRSFWVGLAITLAVCLALVWRRYSFKATFSSGLWLIAAGILAFVLIYLVIIIPYKGSQAGAIGSSFLSRVTSGNEAAVASRWALLPVLWEKIRSEPFLGQGYGATVTYISQDPRVLESNPSGEYTTFAFEWGYLDLWLKLGILGLGAYLWLLCSLIWNALRRSRESGNQLYVGLAAGLIFLAATNIFTPYLNHPLGIGFIVLSSCLIWSNKVY